MKKTTTFFVLLCIYLLTLYSSLLAQPVLVNTMSPFPPGTTDSIYVAPASVAPGGGGAGVTWDLSALAPVAEGIISVVNASSTPYYGTFPTTTFCAKISPIGGGSAYIYERISSTKWEQLANNYSGPGTGTDYTPNPESSLEFPMSYTNSFTDTFQKTGGSANTVTVSYDGYGTLKTPFATYTNVVRINKYWGPGDYDYNWYVTSPYLDIVMSFDAQSNAYTLINQASTAGIKEVGTNETVQVYPNPFFDNTILMVGAPGGLDNASMTITDATGRVVKQIPVTGALTKIDRDGLKSGIYFYRVFNKSMPVAAGKLIIE